jgi:amino acid adenylation domain-containing protein
MNRPKTIDNNVLLHTAEFFRQREYWKNQLSRDLTNTEISFDNKRESSGTSNRLKEVVIPIKSETAVRMVALSKQSDLSIYIIIMAALKLLIFRYTRSNDISVISPVNKLKVKAETLNTFLFIRDQVEPGLTFKELILNIRQTILEAYNNQDYPMEQFLEFLLDEPFGESQQFISNILCALNTLHNEDNTRQLQQELSFLFERSQDILTGIISYDSHLYPHHYIENMADHFAIILENTLADLQVKVSAVHFLTPAEKQKLVLEFNDTAADYPREKTIHLLFEEQAQKSPQSIAVQGLTSLTYKQLNEKANVLAHRLISKGCAAGTTVALMTYPITQMICAVFAVLKTGARYLPIDPYNPGGRVSYLLTDSESILLLKHSHLQDKGNFEGESLNLDDENLYISKDPRHLDNPAPVNSDPDEPVYMIYTSGTTGNPKGVMVMHRNLVNYVNWFADMAQITGADRTVLTSSYAFDLGYTAVFPSLLNGAQLHIIPRETYMMVSGLLEYLRINRITYLKMTPSFFTLIARDLDFTPANCAALRLVVLGGEAINTLDVEHAYNCCPHLRIMNHYGPTEATIGCIAQYVEPKHIQAYKARPTIGKPIYNTSVFILDDHLNLLPSGVAGELCVSGAGIARGYFKRDALTSEKFLQNPQTLQPDPPAVLYKTGDLARWLPDGYIEFLGRKDHQVKVRGFRIELGEIESKLVQHECIKEAVVINSESKNGERYLCAYVVSTQPIPDTELREYLALHLPDYMIPSLLVPLAQLPLTPNGKLDTKALPEPERVLGNRYIAPCNEIQRKLVKIYADVLDLDPAVISCDDNFFQLGGHSLNAIILVSRAHKEFDTHISIPDFFLDPTVAGLAKCIEEAPRQQYDAIKPTETMEYYPLASPQKRLYFFHQLEEGNINYNMPSSYILDGALDLPLLENTFKKLILRHESLRTSFHVMEEELVQQVHPDVEFAIEYDLGIDKETAPYITELNDPRITETIKRFIRYFDLTRPPLIRVGILNITDTLHILVVDMHHIISDGVSQRILLNDFLALYSLQQLPPLKLQYKDYSVWQNHLLKSGEMKQKESYWLRQFQGELPLLNLPLDFKRTNNPDFRGQRVFSSIEEPETAKLKQLAIEAGATLNMVLLALFNILMFRYTDQDDIVVGIPISGRRHYDLNRIIGMFVNILPIRSYPSYKKTVKDFMDEVILCSLKAYENQEYQLDTLIEKLKLERHANRQPLFDVCFIFDADAPQGVQSEILKTDQLTISSYSNDYNKSRFDLQLIAGEVDKQIRFQFHYRAELFKPETIKKMCTHFKNIVKEAAYNPDVKIYAINMLTSGKEENQSGKNQFSTVHSDNDQAGEAALNQEVGFYF